MRMLSEGVAELSERLVRLGPYGELRFDGIDNHLEGLEISIMKTQAPEKLPDALDRVELRRVRRQKIEAETG